jgi:hypothetical protein
VGDCKALLWNKHTGLFTDVTTGNRSTDARDPGGRLGGDTDLRNMCLFYRVVCPGDIIVLCTDGVYDNFDPIFQGKTPRDVGLPEAEWIQRMEIRADQPAAEQERRRKEEAPLLPIIAMQEQKKEEYCLQFAGSLLRGLGQQAATASAIVETFIGHCVTLTQAGRELMESKVGQRQSDDYKRYPGKMDHTTVLSFTVGQPLPPHSTDSPFPSPPTSPSPPSFTPSSPPQKPQPQSPPPPDVMPPIKPLPADAGTSSSHKKTSTKSKRKSLK